MTNSTRENTLIQHQSTFDLVTEGVLWVDQGGKIRRANAAAAGLLGYARKELETRSYLEIDPNYSLLGWKKFWKRLDAERGEFLDKQFVNAGGNLVGVRGKIAFDQLPAAAGLCLIVFTSTEAGRREADLLEALQTDGNISGWEYNVANGQVYLGPQLRTWLGWSPERDFYPAADFVAKLSALSNFTLHPRAAAQLNTLLKSGRRFEHTLTLPAQDGTETELLLRGRSVENELEVFKIFGSAIRTVDLSPPPAPAGDLSAFRFSLDHGSDAILWVDAAENRIVFANARACELTGYPRREITEVRPDHLLPGILNATHLAAARTGKYLELTTDAPRKDGSLYPTRAALHHHRDGEGREYLIVIFQDVAETAQNDEHRRLHLSTLDHLREWVLWLDADNRVVMINAAARKKLSRRTTRALEGLPLEELMPELDIPPLEEIRQDRLDGRARPDVDYVYPDTNGRERTLQIRFVQLAAGSRFFLSLICRDVTTEVNNKRRLRESKRRVDELRKQLESENEALKEEIDTVNASGPIVTVSPRYRKILAQIGQVAGTDATVLVTGETGTGKELLAQSIHNFSNRAARRMVSVNCAALPENLIESELFGHERGAFTGAFAQKKGKFELASGGTIFLDEIGELPLEMQAKLLRALQEGEIQRVGSTEVIKVDVRVVAATNRELEKMIREGTFREDLFYRLNVFPIHNLPLRERTEDIPVLVKHFTRIYAEKMGRNVTQINQPDLEKLRAYDFPGNVRELINLVERAVITSDSSTLNLGASLRALRRTSRPGGNGFLPGEGERLVSLDEMQRLYIREALRRTGGKVTGPGGAAELLDINGRTLMSRMVKLGIDREKSGR